MKLLRLLPVAAVAVFAAASCAQGQQQDQAAAGPSSDVSSSSATGGSGGSGGTGGSGGSGGAAGATGTGGNPSCAMENQPCDDGKFCTENDTCQGGVCSGTPKFCGSMDSCHVGVCDEKGKKCVQMPGNDGAQCDDMDPCTQNGSCQGGQCSKGPPIDCSFFNTSCSQGFCDPVNGCTFKAVNEGGFCDDGKGGQCSVGSCKAGMCISNPLNDGAACDDMMFNDCTHGVCTAGTCLSNPQPKGTPCNGFFFNPCEDGQCDGASNCSPVPKNEGADCDDQMFNPCTQGKCMAGQCISHAKAEGAACDDGKFCTVNDTCQLGFCLGTINKCVPPQGDPCHTAVCDNNQAQCILTAANDGAACDDQNLCSAGETCLNGNCQGGQPANAGMACDDHDGCTGGTTCVAGTTKCGNPDPNQQITQCINGDQCCPIGCAIAADSDCSLTRWSDGTNMWPDDACNPQNSFGSCNTNAQNHADAWATYVCQLNGYSSGVWTGNKKPGCAGAISVWCGGQIPCQPIYENFCQQQDQTQVEFTCFP